MATTRSSVGNKSSAEADTPDNTVRRAQNRERPLSTAHSGDGCGFNCGNAVGSTQQTHSENPKRKVHRRRAYCPYPRGIGHSDCFRSSGWRCSSPLRGPLRIDHPQSHSGAPRAGRWPRRNRLCPSHRRSWRVHRDIRTRRDEPCDAAGRCQH